MPDGLSALTDGQKADCEAAFRKLVPQVDLSRSIEIVTRAQAKLAAIRSVEQPAEILSAMAVADELLLFVQKYDGALKAQQRRIALAALDYLADPWEVIPDIIPKYGLLDDAYVLSLARGMVGEELIDNGGTSPSERLVRSLPPTAGQHLAHRAMERGLLSPGERSFLSSIGDRFTKGAQLKPGELERFAELVQKLRNDGLASQPCRANCATCRALSAAPD